MGVFGIVFVLIALVILLFMVMGKITVEKGIMYILAALVVGLIFYFALRLV